MGKFVKFVVLLALVVGGIVVAMKYMEPSDKPDPSAQQAPSQTDKPGAIQPQEKYGFAPMGEE